MSRRCDLQSISIYLKLSKYGSQNWTSNCKKLRFLTQSSISWWFWTSDMLKCVIMLD